MQGSVETSSHIHCAVRTVASVGHRSEATTQFHCSRTHTWRLEWVGVLAACIGINYRSEGFVGRHLTAVNDVYGSDNYNNNASA